MRYRLGLVGYPLEHSRSPELHHGFLRACGLDGEYRLYPVPPDDEDGLRRLLNSLRGGKIHGLNVTIPHKERAAKLADRLTPAAKAIGAVNTLWAENGVLWGDNTDAPGFWEDLSEKWPAAVRGGLALVLGAGGAARAVVYALAAHGWRVWVAARRREQAEGLCARRGCAVVEWGERAAAAASANLVVNATPVGMHPKVEESPLPAETRWNAATAVYDLVYNPPVTALVAAAREAGAPAFTGFGMLARQARLAFTRWTGCKTLEAALPAEISGSE